MTTVNRIEIPIPFPIRSVNIYFIQDSITTLIDAGFHLDESFDLVESAISNAGYRLTDIQRILLTHGHLDHVGLAGRIAAVSGAEIFIHPLDQDKCIWDIKRDHAKRMEPFLRFFREAGLSETVIQDISVIMNARFKEFFPGRFKVQDITSHGSFSFDDFSLDVIYCPGHTSGSVCFFDRKNGNLFSGDHLLKNITSNAVVEIEGPDKRNGYKSLSSHLKSLEMISAMGVKSVLPGHGAPFSGHRERIDEIIRHHHMRREAVLNVLAACDKRETERPGMTLFMISRKLFPYLRGWDIFLGLSEVHGHLEILKEEGLVSSCKAGGQRFYRL